MDFCKFFASARGLQFQTFTLKNLGINRSVNLSSDASLMYMQGLAVVVCC